MYNITRNMFNAEAFGKFKRFEVRKDSTGAPRTDWEPKEVEDEKAKNIAYAKRGEAEIYMKDWMAKFPNAGVFKALDELNQFLSGKVKPVRSRVPTLAPRNEPATTTKDGTNPTAASMDLPYEPNNVGIPPGRGNVEDAVLLLPALNSDLRYNPLTNGNNP